MNRKSSPVSSVNFLWASSFEIELEVPGNAKVFSILVFKTVLMEQSNRFQEHLNLWNFREQHALIPASTPAELRTNQWQTRRGWCWRLHWLKGSFKSFTGTRRVELMASKINKGISKTILYMASTLPLLRKEKGTRSLRCRKKKQTPEFSGFDVTSCF